MCGRASLSASPDELRAIFDLDEVPEITPRYNIAPTDPMAVIRIPGRLELLRFGLVPAFARDVKEGVRFLNARSETVATQPAFRDAFRERRCLVVVSGFYEWRAEGKKKLPYFVHRPDGKPFALAGLWATWRSREGEVIESCSVITRPASAVLAEVHDRMPVVLAADEYPRWLDPQMRDAEAVKPLLEGHAELLEMYAVSPRVNSVANDDASCIAPLAE